MVISATGCATPYVVNRGRDAADIFTATVGLGAGAKGRMGPLHAGLFAGRDYAGLRGGILTGKFKGGGEIGVPAAEVDCTVVAWYFFHDNRTRDRGKNFSTDFFATTPFYYRLEEPFVRDRKLIPYYTQFEIAVALGPSLRLGFNPGELIDFLLGWTTIDIFRDDIEGKKSNQ